MHWAGEVPCITVEFTGKLELFLSNGAGNFLTSLSKLHQHFPFKRQIFKTAHGPKEQLAEFPPFIREMLVYTSICSYSSLYTAISLQLSCTNCTTSKILISLPRKRERKNLTFDLLSLGTYAPGPKGCGEFKSELGFRAWSGELNGSDVSGPEGDSFPFRGARPKQTSRTRNPTPLISWCPRMFSGRFTEPNRFSGRNSSPGPGRNTARFGKNDPKYPWVPRYV